ncbi:ABC transporter permease subunit [Candidatus Spongiisocius sp.]|uniref:ABC transporter permease subunit n=1 Tax=Candidatus Spongiisocius sp. TaxID=3101273 RepID=UPI003B5BF6A8
MVTPTERSSQTRVPIWRNVVAIKWATQLGILLTILWLGYVVITQATTNLRATGIPFSWDFLGEPLGVKLGEGFNTDPESGLEALAVGMVNMLRVTWSGVIAATILGTVIGISRLSSNWIVSRIANAYIEFFRNIPLLVQILFWQALIVGLLPDLTPEMEGSGWLFTSPKGIAIPWFTPLAGRWQYTVVLIVGVVAARWVYRRRLALQEREGHETHAFAWSVGTFAVFLVGGWFAHPAAGVLGWLFTALAWVSGVVPVIGLQLVLAALAVALAARYIVRYLRRLRSPAGMAKLSDDDYFRLAVAAVVGLGAMLFFVSGAGQATLSSVLGRSLWYQMNWGFEPLFDFLASRFDFSGGAPLRFTLPEVVVPTRFPQYSHEVGKALTPGFLAVWLGVTLYTAAFIAEIVRAGIMAVPRGQGEAAAAVGLRRGQVLRLVVLPQAFRIILPPLGSQYLNLAKNTSLGIAVAFADIVQVGQTIFNQEGQALAVFIFWMGFYSLVSLILSGIVNYYNRKMALVER